MTTFVPFPSISRLSREMVVTEKLDGTNAQVHIEAMGPANHAYCFNIVESTYEVLGDTVYRITAGSRNRWINPTDDNYGFARFVWANASELVKLGPGSHFGEWWGSGIQRGYGLTNGHKNFSLFNVGRWEDPAVRPRCCDVVPVLYRGEFDTAVINAQLTLLGACGSKAAPGFMKPEGVVIYHTKSQTLYKKTLYKKTLDKNDGHKGAA